MAACMINRIPPLILDEKKSYEILFKAKSLYDHIRVFGFYAMFIIIKDKKANLEPIVEDILLVIILLERI